MTKIWVAPESAIASFGAILIAAYVLSNRCCGSHAENADSRLTVEPSDKFDVTTVMSSSSTMILLLGKTVLVGSNEVLITENVSLH